MRVQHDLIFPSLRLCGMSGVILDRVRVPLDPPKIHAHDVLLGGWTGQAIVLLWLRLRR